MILSEMHLSFNVSLTIQLYSLIAEKKIEYGRAEKKINKMRGWPRTCRLTSFKDSRMVLSCLKWTQFMTKGIEYPGASHHTNYRFICKRQI